MRNILDEFEFEYPEDIVLPIVEQLFTAEGLSFDDWRIFEIPLIDSSGEYPTAVVVSIANDTEKRCVCLCLSSAGTVVTFLVGGGGCVGNTFTEIRVSTLKEAISHPNSRYCEDEDARSFDSFKEFFLDVLRASKPFSPIVIISRVAGLYLAFFVVDSENPPRSKCGGYYSFYFYLNTTEPRDTNWDMKTFFDALSFIKDDCGCDVKIELDWFEKEVSK